MPRIVAGVARGRRLVVPGRGTRPTSDRAREALFSTLAGLVDLEGAHVLDLYAGSGAVGLEALSRGASRAVLVESASAATKAIARNVATVALPGATVVQEQVDRFLAAPPSQPEFDVVFADPPYDVPDETLAAQVATAAAGWLRRGGVVVVERATRTGWTWPPAVDAVKQRRYGDGTLWYGRRL